MRLISSESLLFEIDRIPVQTRREDALAILKLANKNVDEPSLFGFIDVVIQRNAFGRQLDSFSCEAHIPHIAAESIPLTFIRAPKILQVGPGVEVLLHLDDYIAAAENQNVLITVFHPELSASLAFHRYFARKCGFTFNKDDKDQETDLQWTRTSWMRSAAG